MRLRWVLLGIGAGVLWTVSPGTVFVLTLALGIGLLLYRNTDPQGRKFILALFLTGFFLRAALSLGLDGLSCLVEREIPHKKGAPNEDVLNIVDHTRRFMQMGDSDYHSERGYALAQRAKGNLKILPRYYREEYGKSSHMHVIAAFYSLFDFSPVAVKFLNCLIGALLGPLLFLIFRRCFREAICRWASGVTAFFPSQILWSVTNLKEPFLFTLTAGILLSFLVGLQQIHWQRRAGCGVLILLLLGIHSDLRSPIYTAALAGSLAAAAFFTSRIPRTLRVAGLLLLAGLVFHLGRPHVRPMLEQAFTTHIGHITTPGTTYRYLPNEFYGSREYVNHWARTAKINSSVLRWMGKAGLHYLLEPLPKRINSLFLSLTYPQMVFWYFSLPFAFAGIIASFRWNLRRTLFLLLLIGSWTLVGSLTSGNVGTVFRVREMVTPYYLLFACTGWWAFLKGRRAIVPDHA